MILKIDTAMKKKDDLFKTPESLSKLALSILDVKNNESLADFGSGTGTFLGEAYKQGVNANLYGIDLDADLNQISSTYLHSLVEGKDTEKIPIIQSGDFLNENYKCTFDKIFCDHPYKSNFSKDEISALVGEFPFLEKRRCADWAYAISVMKHLKKSGKAVSFMVNSSAWNYPEKEARECFIKNGWIEAVITLPPRIFYYTGISVVMLVLSQGNKDIHFVDASHTFEKGRRINQFNDENIKVIMDALKHDGEISKTVSYDEVAKNDFSIMPAVYLPKPEEITHLSKYGTLMRLQDLAVKIGRGAPIMASQLDKLDTEEDTGIGYITLTDIQDGITSENLKHLSSIPDAYEKYLVKDEDVVLSKVGNPPKVGIVAGQEGHAVLATGNIFTIELDKSKIDPYYLLAFFDGPSGQVVLSESYAGTVIPNLRIQDLREIQIPVPSIDIQKKIAEEYRAALKDIVAAKKLLAKSIESKAHIFDKNMEGE